MHAVRDSHKIPRKRIGAIDLGELMLPRPAVGISACPLHKSDAGQRRTGQGKLSCLDNLFYSRQVAQVWVNTMADIYVDYVLNEDDRQASLLGPSRGPFVAIGSHVWAVWQIVLRFKHRYHGEFTAVSMLGALRDSVFGASTLPYERAPVNYPKNMYCKLFVWIFAS